jgi:hypothetical protein
MVFGGASGASRSICRLAIMHKWSEELEKRTLGELKRMKDENRAWSKQLRTGTTTLVNSRLAKEIDLAEYWDKRDIAYKDAAESQRRGRVLDHEISIRASAAWPSPPPAITSANSF